MARFHQQTYDIRPPLRIACLTTFYPLYLRKFYANQPFFKNESYIRQQEMLLDDLFGWSDFFPRNFRKLGHNAMEIVANAEWLQKQWAAEHHQRYQENNWIHDIVIAQLKEFQPDVLFIEDCFTFTSAKIQEIRSKISSIKFVLLHHGARDEGITAFKEADLVVTNFQWLSEKLKRQKIGSVVLKHAFETTILDKLEKQKRCYEVSFVGSLFPVHHRRYRLLRYLSDKVPISIWTPSLNTSISALIVSCLKSIFKGRLKSFVDHEINLPIRKRFRGQAFGQEMYQVFHDSKITVSVHEDAQNGASNMRLFEATGVGTCLVTDWQENLPELFEPEKEVVTFRSPEECVEKIKWLLAHPRERDAVARAGQARTLRDHTFKQRAAQIIDIIERNLKPERQYHNFR